MSLTALIHEYSQDLYQKGKVNLIARNPTFGTGIACNADPTAIAATEGMLVIANTNSGQVRLENKVVVPKLIRLTCTAAGTGGISARFRFAIDKINRYSSGGTELTVRSALANTDETDVTEAAKVYFGDLTLAAADTEKELDGILAHTASTPCFAVGNSYTFEFEGAAGQNGFLDSVVHRSFRVPSVQLGPQYSLIVQPLFASQSAAASFEVHVEFMELYHSRT